MFQRLSGGPDDEGPAVSDRDGRIIAAPIGYPDGDGNWEAGIRRWEVQAGRVIADLHSGLPEADRWRWALSPDGTRTAMPDAADRAVIRETTAGRVIHRLTGPVNVAAFTSDERTLLTGSTDRTVRIRTVGQSRTPPGPRSSPGSTSTRRRSAGDGGSGDGAIVGRTPAMRSRAGGHRSCRADAARFFVATGAIRRSGALLL